MTERSGNRFLRDTRLMFMRSVRPLVRQPLVIVLGTAQPMLFLLLFGPLLGGFGSDEDSWQWFVPGLVIQMALFGTAYAGYVLMPEIRSGVLERLQVTPISRIALLLGRVLRDVGVLLIQCVILLAVSTLFGFRAGPGQIALVLFIGALAGVSIAATSHTLALKVKHEYVFGPLLGGTVMPVLLLSGALLPMDQGPDWLYALSRVNPLSYAVDAVRAIVEGRMGDTVVWSGGLVIVALSGLCLYWGVRTFRKEAL
ncbi:ABC transporter permease [Micromonospora sp. NPDC002296]|uniref:ABC transporter permease n=1 Tax=Micromonospora sp. NPDC002296 TaxID=3154271 RepID=UPI00332BD42F